MRILRLSIIRFRNGLNKAGDLLCRAIMFMHHSVFRRRITSLGDTTEMPTFSTWFFSCEKYNGFRRVINCKLFRDLLVGLVLAKIIETPAHEIANTVLIPITGTLIGLTFAWAGNAQSLLESEEIKNLSESHPGGYITYLYTYQLSVLFLIIVVVIWSLAGLHVWDYFARTKNYQVLYAIRAFYFMITTTSLRICWNVVSSVSFLMEIKRLFQQRK